MEDFKGGPLRQPEREDQAAIDRYADLSDEFSRTAEDVRQLDTLADTDAYAKAVSKDGLTRVGELAQEMEKIRNGASRTTLEKIREIGRRNGEWWASNE